MLDVAKYSNSLGRFVTDHPRSIIMLSIASTFAGVAIVEMADKKYLSAAISGMASLLFGSAAYSMKTEIDRKKVYEKDFGYDTLVLVPLQDNSEPYPELDFSRN